MQNEYDAARSAGVRQPLAIEDRQSLRAFKLVLALNHARRLQPALAWAAVALVAVGLLAAGVVARERLQAWWPPSQALFELAGLAGNRAGVGLEIRNLVYRRENGGHTPALVVAGEVVNRSDRVIDVPKLRASLYDGREREIHTWFFAAKRDRLAPGEAVPIASSTRDSPSGVRRIEVRFAE